MKILFRQQNYYSKFELIPSKNSTSTPSAFQFRGARTLHRKLFTVVKQIICRLIRLRLTQTEILCFT